MKAIVFDRHGGPEVLHATEVEVPEPGTGQVRIRVRAAGVNPIDGKLRSGGGWPIELPSIPGVEAAGVVDALGPDVTDLAVGDEVLGPTATGSYAQFALSSRMVLKPAGLTWDTAAALPVAAETALRVLRLLDLSAGETLLVHGASGSVGGLAVQLARQRGVTVVGTAGAAGRERLGGLGAIAIGYGDGLIDRVRSVAPQGIDAVLDAAGKGALPDSIALRGGPERIVTIADPNAAEYGVLFTGGPEVMIEPAEVADVAKRVAAGELTVPVAARYPLADAAEAQQLSDSGHAGGKLVLIVD
ncbi:NADPH:quinone reductase [Actinocatenispora thailandica]|uniref:NADPH:quinone reductase n=1 Tax=Actinocatenispora thailandica TaxID=227318 RepID=A0A7R7DKE9_9ACTN|nr:NADP-dependent oxidoreductase [Actinocatenispora thailandica]BCJ33300.1 NADPH:quinone reductase [Actinocatenispora thailandica]